MACPFQRCICALALLLLSGVCRAWAAQPEISAITRFGNNQVLIHFDTDPNKTYYLQSINRLTCTTNRGCSKFNVPTNQWSNIYTAFAFPFPNHYIITDTRTTRQRYYRLHVTTP